MIRRCSSARALLLGFLLVATAACKEEGGVKVSSFKINGNHAVTDAQLKSVLATHASSRLPWGQKRYFSREQFAADLKRIVAFYNDRGYPNARITSFDAKLNRDQTAVEITIDIEEGEPVRVQRIVFEGLDALPPAHRAALESGLPLKPGRPLDRALLQASRESALDELRDHGYPYASVKVSEAPGSSPRERIVTLAADPGPLSKFGPIEIVGNRSVGDDVIRRQLTYRPGRPYRQSALQQSQRKLYSAELFEFVNIEPVRAEDKPPEVPTRVTVTEGKHRRVNFGVGYGTEEKARVMVDWRHVNFFGGARTAGVLARYSSLDRGVRLNLKQPYFFSPQYDLNLAGQSWHSAEPAFTLDTNGGRATVTRQFRRGGGPVFGTRSSTTLSFTYANELDRYSISNEALQDLSFRPTLIALGLDPRTGTGKGTRSAISFDGGRNTTNNLLDAKRGYLVSTHVERAGKWLGGTYDYFEQTTEARYFHSFGKVVAAVQARAGSIEGFGDQETAVPFFKRYFLGGATNLRGWGRFEVAPLSGGGLPIGGFSFLNFSTELRAPLRGSFGAVLFLDGGNVWSNPWNVRLNDLRYDVGPGLRYQTPVGPLRIDLGYQLNPIPGLLVNGAPQARRFRLHFSIGQAF
jgi:outer membrane protein insertion porin family/translocation and assembly module TamA